MAEADPLRKYVEAGIAFTQLTKARAETIVRELVKAGEVQREQTQDRVEELLDRSRKSTEGLVGIVRREIAQQLASLGIATREDIERLEARIEARLAATHGAAPGTGGAQAQAPAATSAKKTARTTKTAAKAGASAKAAPGPATPPTPPPGTAARTAAAAKARRRPGTGTGGQG